MQLGKRVVCSSSSSHARYNEAPPTATSFDTSREPEELLSSVAPTQPPLNNNASAESSWISDAAAASDAERVPQPRPLEPVAGRNVGVQASHTRWQRHVIGGGGAGRARNLWRGGSTAVGGPRTASESLTSLLAPPSTASSLSRVAADAERSGCVDPAHALEETTCTPHRGNGNVSLGVSADSSRSPREQEEQRAKRSPQRIAAPLATEARLDEASSLHSTNEAVLSLQVQLEQYRHTTQQLQETIRRITAERSKLQHELGRVRMTHKIAVETDVPALVDETNALRQELERVVADRARLELDNRRLQKDAKLRTTEAEEANRCANEASAIADSRAAECAKVAAQLETLRQKYAQLEATCVELQSERFAIVQERKTLRAEAAEAALVAQEAERKAAAATALAANAGASAGTREEELLQLRLKVSQLESSCREATLKQQADARDIENLRNRNALLERKAASTAHLEADAETLEALRVSNARLEQSRRDEQRRSTDAQLENSKLRLTIDDLLFQCSLLRQQLDEVLRREEGRCAFGEECATALEAPSDASSIAWTMHNNSIAPAATDGAVGSKKA